MGLFIPIVAPIFKDSIPLVYSILYIILGISLLTIFVPNKTNLDDNTSGVITLLKLAEKLKLNGITNTKLIFVDNEELGLFGSRAHFRYLKNENLIENNCKVFSIDSVGGEGEIPLIIRNGASGYLPAFEKELIQEFGICKSTKMSLPASDNYSFRQLGALNLSFVSKAVLPGGYSIKNIHSSKDTKINIERIDRICDVLINVIKEDR